MFGVYRSRDGYSPLLLVSSSGELPQLPSMVSAPVEKIAIHLISDWDNLETAQEYSLVPL